MSKIKTATFDAPAFWASALINGDESSFDYYGKESKEEFDQWFELMLKAFNGKLYVVGCSEEPHFGRFNGKGCDLLTYTAHVQ
jgi:hypothetical protein